MYMGAKGDWDFRISYLVKNPDWTVAKDSSFWRGIEPGGPLVLIDRSRLCAGAGFHLLPSLLNHSTYNTLRLLYKNNYIYSPPNLTSFSTQTQIHIPPRNVVCPSGAWFENRPHLTPSIHLTWNPKHVIVQRVGIGTHTHTHTLTCAQMPVQQIYAIHYTAIRPIHNVVCPSSARFENRPHSPS